jgi:4-oxalocrotonate tautomerase
MTSESSCAQAKREALWITLNEGRSVEVKQAFYKNLAEGLHRELGVRMEDVLVNLIEVKKEN